MAEEWLFVVYRTLLFHALDGLTDVRDPPHETKKMTAFNNKLMGLLALVMMMLDSCCSKPTTTELVVYRDTQYTKTKEGGTVLYYVERAGGQIWRCPTGAVPSRDPWATATVESIRVDTRCTRVNTMAFEGRVWGVRLTQENGLVQVFYMMVTTNRESYACPALPEEKIKYMSYSEEKLQRPICWVQ